MNNLFPQLPKHKARTTVEIKGSCIVTIPKGTEFTVTHIGHYYSSCIGLGINSIWNNEYVLLDKDGNVIAQTP